MPVVTRLPDQEETVVREYVYNRLSFHWERIVEHQSTMDIPDQLINSLCVLSETRVLETNERFLLEQNQPDDAKWKLSYDYIRLLARLMPPTTAELAAWSDETALETTEQESWWYEQIGIAPWERIVEQVFQKHLHLGQMLNVDNEPNIAFRVKTLHLMLESLIAQFIANSDSISDDVLGAGSVYDRQILIDNALREAGRVSGRDFGAELQKTYRQQTTEDDFEERLRKWAIFDSGSGFGNIELVEYNSSIAQGIFLVYNNSFERHPTISKSIQYELDHIFQGYMEAVIEYIFKSIKKNSNRNCAVQVISLTGEDYMGLLKRLPTKNKVDKIKIAAYKFNIKI